MSTWVTITDGFTGIVGILWWLPIMFLYRTWGRSHYISYHYEDRGGEVQAGERVGAVDPPVSQPVEDQSQQSSSAENTRQAEDRLTIVSPVAPDLQTSPLPSR